MIYIRIEVWPGGNKVDAKLVSEMVVGNVGKYTEDGEYEVKISKPDGFKAEPYKLNSMTQTGRHRERLLDPLPSSVLARLELRHKRSRGIWQLLRKVFGKLAREVEDGTR